MTVLVCDITSSMCMIHRCSKCPGKGKLFSYLRQLLLCNEEDEDKMVTFSQWETTDRPDLSVHTLSIHDFIEKLSNKLDRLTSHSFISKAQSSHLKYLKQNIKPEECIILLDFAENYSFLAQDEVQSFFWNCKQCTIHPAVVYYKNSMGLLKSKSYAFVSNDLKHDTPFVFEVQKGLIADITSFLPGVTKIYYFSDGCAGQYKNYKNFMNLCSHDQDFSLNAEWIFLLHLMANQLWMGWEGP